MTGIEWFLIGIGAKLVADLGVRISKRTENHIDDFIFESLKSVLSGVSLFKKK